MNDFLLWFVTGFEHIADLNGYDHILFVSLLVFSFPFREWKKLIAIVTAFTVGHSLSLALSVLNKVHISQPVIELLIALSILATAVHDLICFKKEKAINVPVLFAVVLFFGLIHGLGFSFLLRAMLGKEETVFLPLLYFNVGLEFGQLLIVAVVLLFSLLLAQVFKIPHKIYKLVFVCIIALISIKLTAERSLLLFSP